MSLNKYKTKIINIIALIPILIELIEYVNKVYQEKIKVIIDQDDDDSSLKQ